MGDIFPEEFNLTVGQQELLDEAADVGPCACDVCGWTVGCNPNCRECRRIEEENELWLIKQSL